ncbi:universal stress protein [uncultured Tenacibaculum sp.]|uniref:universal stress protein n=1 Tax=uncultured Tenacibaculum sp. TaxID=174713 RepID=UPI00260C6344|nr:universal stress protein [uncultured Tenacibaculum sp.]
MKNILIPYDFSEAAINSLRYTKKLFEGEKLNIFLLDVYIGERSNLLSEEHNQEWFNGIDDEIEDELKYLVEILNNEKNNFTYHSIVDSNSLTKSVNATVLKEKITLIVCGTKGAKSLAQTFIGTNTLNIINAVESVPIIVVPIDYKYKKIDKITFSTNYKRTFNKKELETLLKLSKIKKCDIEVVNLSEDDALTNKQRTHKVKLRELLQDVNTSFKKLDWDDSEANTIQKHIEIEDRKLLVFINHHYNFFNTFLNENVIKKITFNSKIPLLILPEFK